MVSGTLNDPSGATRLRDRSALQVNDLSARTGRALTLTEHITKLIMVGARDDSGRGGQGRRPRCDAVGWFPVNLRASSSAPPRW